MPMLKYRNDGLWKVRLSHRQWSRCSHPGHFSFQWKDTHHRFSLDRYFGNSSDSKGDAETAAHQLRLDIKANKFQRAGEVTLELYRAPACRCGGICESGDDSGCLQFRPKFPRTR